MSAPGRFLSIAETAELWGTTERFVRLCIARGDLTAYRIGSRMIRLKSADVDAFAHPIPTAGTVAAR